MQKIKLLDTVETPIEIDVTVTDEETGKTKIEKQAARAKMVKDAVHDVDDDVAERLIGMGFAELVEAE